MFIRKYWIPLTVLLVAIVGVSLYYLQIRPPKKPVLIITPVEVEKPAAEAPVSNTSQDGHFHADGTWHAETHAPISETQPRALTDRDTGTDWRDDINLEKPPMNNPWENLKAQQTEIDMEISNSEDPQIDPPQDWHLTEDPKLYTKYFRAQLIKQFGDRPEVHTLADTTLKIRQNIPLTRDEYIADLEAQYALWPDPRTLRVLEEVEKTGDTSFIQFEENQE